MPIPATTPSQRQARWHEFLVYLCNRPFTFIFLDIVRRLGDVVHVPPLGYFVHHPAIAKAVLADPKVSNSEVGSYGALFTQVLGPFALINMEGPEHRQLKSHLREFFTEDRLERLIGAELRQSVVQLREALDSDITVDLSDFMRGLSTRLFCRILGIAPSGGDWETECKHIYRLSARMTSRGALLKRLLSEAEVNSAKVIHRELAGYTRAAYQRTDLEPSSIIAGLKTAGYSYTQVEGLLTSLLIAGTAIVTLAVPRIAAVLLDSGAFVDLRNDPTMLKAAIDECLRFITPSNVLFRVATDDVVVDRHTVPKGSRIYVVFYSLMKHKGYFRRPHDLDIRREIPNEIRYLWFGHGRHSCLGIALAHRIVHALIEMLIGLDGTLVVGPRAYGRNLIFPGYERFCIGLRRA